MFNKADCEISQLVVRDDLMAVELEKLLIPTIQSRRSSAVPVSLMQRKQQLQKEVQGWIDWTNVKALWQQEEREKTKLLQKAESIWRERQQRKQKTKMEEEKLIAKAEENSRVKLAAVGESSSQQGGIKREWECVMCLTEPKSVVFLPCAHKALCTNCNVLHERQGMKDCPVYRTPIMKRIQACFVPPKAH
ncbi:putative E3 ubiquitin-protein ligase RF4 [Ipomoea triloba]|uniref:putative E3 ubiquitin-protein ligase RF4 n=1 Tax=Ipomoea triloba TaxID=35885 RepID=UPI00125CEC18|nr:putative E3 ubiquitin-protein ligase RF4 [Ipomoea triloba]